MCDTETKIEIRKMKWKLKAILSRRKEIKASERKCIFTKGRFPTFSVMIAKDTLSSVCLYSSYYLFSACQCYLWGVMEIRIFTLAGPALFHCLYIFATWVEMMNSFCYSTEKVQNEYTHSCNTQESPRCDKLSKKNT